VHLAGPSSRGDLSRAGALQAGIVFGEEIPDPSEYLPFGGANRRCIGAAFAVYEMQIVLATLFAKGRFEAAAEREQVRRRSITFTPKNGAG